MELQALLKVLKTKQGMLPLKKVLILKIFNLIPPKLCIGDSVKFNNIKLCHMGTKFNCTSKMKPETQHCFHIEFQKAYYGMIRVKNKCIMEFLQL